LKGDDQWANFIEQALTKSRNEIYDTFNDINLPLVKTISCIIERNQDEPALVFDDDSVIGKIIERGYFIVGALKGRDHRKDFKYLLQKIIDYFSFFGYRIEYSVQKYESGQDLEIAMKTGEIDLIHPDFYINEFTQKRKTILRPICTGFGLEFAYYVKEKEQGAGSPYKNMKQLMEETFNTQKNIIVFNKDIRDILLRLYPFGRDYFTINDNPDESLDLLNSKYVSAVFVLQSFNPKRLTKNSVSILKNYFVYPLELYTRLESPYINVESNEKFDDYQKGNTLLRNILDYVLFTYQKSNSHFSFTESARTATFGDCLGSVPTLPKKIKKKGVIGRIIETKEIRVGYVMGNSELLNVESLNGIVTVSGPYVKFEKKIFKLLGSILKIDDLRVEPVAFKSSELLFSALDEGVIDVTSASMIEGASRDGSDLRYGYQFTCSTGAWPLSVVVKRDSNIASIKTFADLKSYLSSTKSKIVCRNSAMASLIAYDIDLFYKSKIQIVSSDEEGLSLLNDDSFLAYVPEFVSTVPSDYKIIHTSEYVPTTFFLRRDHKHLEPTYDNKAFYVGKVIFAMILGAASFVCIYLLFKLLAPKTSANVNEEEIPLTVNNTESLGEDNDPDYVAPQF